MQSAGCWGICAAILKNPNCVLTELDFSVSGCLSVRLYQTMHVHICLSSRLSRLVTRWSVCPFVYGSLQCLSVSVCRCVRLFVYGSLQCLSVSVCRCVRLFVQTRVFHLSDGCLCVWVVNDRGHLHAVTHTHTHTHTHTRTRTHARTLARTHTHRHCSDV